MFNFKVNSEFCDMFQLLIENLLLRNVSRKLLNTIQNNTTT